MLTIKDLEISITNSDSHQPMVHGVNLTLSPNRPLTLMGETGCGKSLIAQAIFDLLPREMEAKGKIYYDNRNLLTLSGRKMHRLWGREIFLFPQEPGSALNPLRRSRSQVTEIFKWVANKSNNGMRLSAGIVPNPSGIGLKVRSFHFSNLPFAGRRYNRIWKDRFRQVDLSVEDGSKFPWQLSGGMSQRLLAVMALAEPARLIVADEPTKGLDSDTCALTIKLLRKMAASNKGLFVITHDPKVPRQLKGDLAVMYKGMIMETGPAEAVLDSPRHPYTRALLRALPENGLHPIPLKVNGNTFQGGCPFSPRCTEALPCCFHLEPAEQKHQQYIPKRYPKEIHDKRNIPKITGLPERPKCPDSLPFQTIRCHRSGQS